MLGNEKLRNVTLAAEKVVVIFSHNFRLAGRHIFMT
jgi:hypothetical protein